MKSSMCTIKKANTRHNWHLGVNYFVHKVAASIKLVTEFRLQITYIANP